MSEVKEIQLKNFIGGKFVPSSNFIESFNPSTGLKLVDVPDSEEVDVVNAVNAAKNAFPSWSAKSVEDRAKILRRIADIIESKLDEFSEAESLDQGKPLWLSKTIEIPRAILNFRHFATTALCDTDKSLYQPNDEVLNYTVHLPVGVAGIIVPWNLPLYLLTFKLAPALVYGNTVVVKPSEFTSLTAYLLCNVLQEAGIPDGVVNVVFGYGHKVGDALVRHPDVPLLSFTGSTKTGCQIAEIAGKMSKKVSAEMGGKNAAVVFDDADILNCVTNLIRGSFLNQGQVCLSTSRIYIQRSLYPVFVDLFVKETKRLKIGGSTQDGTWIGPVCSKQHLEKIKYYLQLAKKEGATFLTGSEELDLCLENQKGYFVNPTVLTGLPDSSRCMQEEIFGPVTCLMPFDTDEEIISRVNGTNFGLCASLWSRSVQRIHSIAPKLEVGTVWCNCWLVRNLHMPFGGMKMSGSAREGTEGSREFYTTQKTICIKFS